MPLPRTLTRLFGWFALVVVPWSVPCTWAQRIEVEDAQFQPLFVESAEVSAEVTGRIAVTTFDLVFRNPNAQVLEGTFLFPLLDGQNVVGFALDIGGQMREAVPVEKTRARVVFEDIERRASDPGLLERAQGDVYRARVYPIPARGVRRVRLSYQEDLAPVGDQTSYRVNLAFPQALKRFRLALNVHTGASMPAQVRTTLDLPLPPWREGQFMEIEREDFDARGLFELVIPKAEHPRALTGRFKNKQYFYAEVPTTPLLYTRPVPKTVGLLWDSSGSGRNRDHPREFAILDAWFADLKNVDVRLVRLRDRATRGDTFSVRDGDWKQLRQELESTSYDGASSTEGLVDDPKVDVWILFSDALFNYGANEASSRLPFHNPVHVVLASTRADSRWLRTAAANSGGEFIHGFELDPKKAAFALQTQSMRLLAVDYDPESVSSFFPQPGTPIQSESLVITGVLRRPEALVRLHVGHSRQNAQVLEVRILSGEDRSPLAPRGWALAKIDALSADAAANRQDIQDTSRDFGIVTDDTSLLVLESVSDYLRHDIAPPDELRSEWEARHASTEINASSARQQHLETVVKAFRRRVAWWEKEFPRGLPKGGVPPERPSKDPVVGPGVEGGIEGSPLEPAPPDLGEARRIPDSEGPGASRHRAAASQVAPDPKSPSATRSSLAESSIPSSSTISLRAWTPDSGYRDQLRRAPSERRYAVYLEQRSDHASSPGFFLDVADFFFETGENDLALRVLSNLAELEVDDPALLRVLGHRLMQANHAELAVPVFQRVLRLRPEEPQSRRDLALACAASGKFQRAIDLLWEIVSEPWDSRFPDIELIALSELNAIIATCGEKLDVGRIDPRLLRNLPLDVRAVLTWDANDSDIDLWVTDPNGETAKYDYPLTYQGGMLSRDFTGGYGPEEFLLRRAKSGSYRVRINYYGDRRQTALGPVTAQVRLITGFGTPQQQEKRLTVRLKAKQETVEVGTIEISLPRKIR